MKRILFFVSVLIGLMICSCSSNSGSEFLGTWSSASYSNDCLKISKNGKSFLIENVSGLGINEGAGGIYTLTQEGNLSGAGGFMTIAYDKENNQIILYGKKRFNKLNS